MSFFFYVPCFLLDWYCHIPFGFAVSMIFFFSSQVCTISITSRKKDTWPRHMDSPCDLLCWCDLLSHHTSFPKSLSYVELGPTMYIKLSNTLPHLQPCLQVEMQTSREKRSKMKSKSRPQTKKQMRHKWRQWDLNPKPLIYQTCGTMFNSLILWKA